ncbi:MAG TPA: flagellar biosynthetic protein FliO [Pseudomonas sp.]|nr:flagellar biosynthetic protein FliO [Pseudomonas sp.]
MRRLFLAPWLLVAAGEALAAPASAATTEGVLGQIVQLLLGLGLVVALIFGLAWLLKRMQNQTGPRGNQAIQLLASQSLGTRERLLLVQVGEEQVLLGLTAGRITPLHVLKEPVVLPATSTTTPDFARRLQDLLGRDKTPPAEP